MVNHPVMFFCVGRGRSEKRPRHQAAVADVQFAMPGNRMGQAMDFHGWKYQFSLPSSIPLGDLWLLIFGDDPVQA